MSGYIVAGYGPKLEGNVEEGIVIQGGAMFSKNLQNVFGTVEFGAGTDFGKEFCSGLSRWRWQKQLWATKVFLLFRAYARWDISAKDLTFTKYMKCSLSLDKTDQKLVCVCLWWSREDKMDHTVDPGTSSTKKGIWWMENGFWWNYLDVCNKWCILCMPTSVFHHSGTCISLGIGLY